MPARSGPGPAGDETFGALLTRLRLARGRSQLRLAEMLCAAAGVPTITRHEVSRWERGERVPGAPWLAWIAFTLDVPLDDLERAAARSRHLRAPARPRQPRTAEAPAAGTGADAPPQAGRNQTSHSANGALTGSASDGLTGGATGGTSDGATGGATGGTSDGATGGATGGTSDGLTNRANSDLAGGKNDGLDDATSRRANGGPDGGTSNGRNIGASGDQAGGTSRWANGGLNGGPDIDASDDRDGRTNSTANGGPDIDASDDQRGGASRWANGGMANGANGGPDIGASDDWDGGTNSRANSGPDIGASGGRDGGATTGGSSAGGGARAGWQRGGADAGVEGGRAMSWWSVAELRRMDDLVSGVKVARVVRAAYAGAVRAAAGGGRERLRLVAELAQLAAWVAADAGAPVSGAAVAGIVRDGVRAALTGGHRALAGHLLGCLAQLHAEEGDGVTALRLARAGRQAAEPADAGTLAVLWLREAAAAAAGGERSRCDAALAAARRAQERRTGEHDPSWLYWLDDAHLAAAAGRCQAALGRHRLALPLLAAALGPPPRPGSPAHLAPLRPDTLVRTDALERTDRSDRRDALGRTDGPDWPDAPAPPGAPDRTDRPDRPDASVPPGAPERTDAPVRTGAAVWAAAGGAGGAGVVQDAVWRSAGVSAPRGAGVAGRGRVPAARGAGAVWASGNAAGRSGGVRLRAFGLVQLARARALVAAGEVDAACEAAVEGVLAGARCGSARVWREAEWVRPRLRRAAKYRDFTEMYEMARGFGHDGLRTGSAGGGVSD
ncbi:hypothetical protein [Dactylosporangium sp. CA-233914]|uniref:helix-turn-helix transcriptional regulator n=1 Tax=Dactylosporangium sp. CA-233914 TaxID=3239934 RepID=UPI003D91624E